MTIKTQYDTQADIPEGLSSLYSQNDSGVFALNPIEGMVNKSQLDDANKKVDEFRQNNTALNKKFEGVDVDEWKTLQDDKRKMADKELIEAGEVDELINRRVNEVVSKMNLTIEDLTTTNSNLTGSISAMTIDAQLRKLATDSGIRADAVEDVVALGRTNFKISNEGKVETTVSELSSTGELMTIDSWVTGLKTEKPYYYPTGTGSNASGKGAVVSDNTNLTPQQRIVASLEKTTPTKFGR